MGTLVIHTAPGANVTVEQVRHEFWFGATLPGRKNQWHYALACPAACGACPCEAVGGELLAFGFAGRDD